MKRTTAALLGWGAGAGLACVALAVGPLQAALGPRYGGEIAVGVARDAAAATPALRLTDETLVSVNARGQVEPRLARAIELSADGPLITLTLRPGLAFHDGEPLDAPAAVASLHTFLRSRSPAAQALAESLVGGLVFRDGEAEAAAGLRALDERRLSLRLERASASALPALASPAAAIRSARGAGSGPFVGTPSGDWLALRPFTQHFEGRPFLDRIVIVPIVADGLRDAVRRGRVDVALGGEDGGPSAEAGRTAARLLLLLDRSRPPFDDAAARIALDAVLDPSAFGPPLLPAATPARVLLQPFDRPRPAAVATPGARWTANLTLAVDGAVPPAASQRVVACLASLGLRVGVRTLASSSATAMNPAPAEARLFLHLPEVEEPGLVLRELARLASAGAETLEALDGADRLAPGPERQRALERAEELLLNERGLLPLARMSLGVHARAGVHGLRLDHGGLRLADTWIEP